MYAKAGPQRVKGGVLNSEIFAAVLQSSCLSYHLFWTCDLRPHPAILQIACCLSSWHGLISCHEGISCCCLLSLSCLPPTFLNQHTTGLGARAIQKGRLTSRQQFWQHFSCQPLSYLCRLGVKGQSRWLSISANMSDAGVPVWPWLILQKWLQFNKKLSFYGYRFGNLGGTSGDSASFLVSSHSFITVPD